MPSSALASQLVGELKTTLPSCAAGTCAVSLQAGQAAPFSGQLVPPDLAVRLVGNVTGCQQALLRARMRCQREKNLASQQASRRDAEQRQRYEEEASRLQARLNVVAEALENNRPPFYARPWFVALATASVMTTLMIVSLR